MRKLFRRIHRFFSKGNFRLLSLLGIAFAVVVTVALAQQQQDLRQRAQNCTSSSCLSSEQIVTKYRLPAGFSCKASDGIYYGYSSYRFTSSSCNPDEKDVANIVKASNGSGDSSDQIRKNLEQLYESSGRCCVKPTQSSGGNDGTTCGSTTCTASEICVGVPNLSTTQYKCVPKPSGGSGDPNPGGSGGGTTNPDPNSGQSICGSDKFVACGNGFCCDGKTCGSDSKCYDPPTNSNGGGETGGGCSSGQTQCGDKCWSCGTAGIDCVSNAGVCKNGGCGTGQVALGSTCCPTGTKEVCADGKCGPCNVPTLAPPKKPEAFSSNPTVSTDCTSAILSWGSSAGAKSYIAQAYKDPSQAPYKEGLNLSASTFTYKFTGLTKGEIYYFTAVAVDSTNTKKRSFTVTGVMKTTCNTTTTGQTAGTTKKTPTASTTNNTGSSTTLTPVPPKTSSPTITTKVTASPSQGSQTNNATIAFTFTLPGIGASSDNKNSNPKRKQRMINVGIINSGGSVTSSQGTATFDSSTNSYKGSVVVSNLTSGTYTTKIRIDNTLWKKLPGSITLSGGSSSPTTSTTQLISGDVDQNNSLAIADYTNFVKCYKGLSTCSSSLKSLTDFDDDGVIKDDLDDLTILQQGFNTQTQGD